MMRVRWRTLMMRLGLPLCLYLVYYFTYNKPHYIIAMPQLPMEHGTCNIPQEKLGLQNIDMHPVYDIQTLVDANPGVSSGGWSPSGCQAVQRVAIIIPYRDRWQHLMLLLHHLHPMLQMQMLHYRIYVIEQTGQEKFNRGKLLNVGTLEALKDDDYDCIIFHDVDLIPENTQNLYMCDNELRHLSSAIDEMRYHVPYFNYAGGVAGLTIDNTRKINGYSNEYWGWGNEDDDFSARCQRAGLLLSRPPLHIGRYKMVRHPKSWRSDKSIDMFRTWRSRWQNDGLSSTKYQVLMKEDMKIFTLIRVDLGHPPDIPPYNETTPRESMLWYLLFHIPS